MNTLWHYLPNTWTLSYSLCQVSQFENKLDSYKYRITVSTSHQQLQFIGDAKRAGCQDCLTNNTTITIAVENISLSTANGTIQPVNKAHTVAIVHPSENVDISTFAAYNLILDPQFLAMEPSPRENSNRIFNRRFGVLLSKNNITCARKLSNLELLKCYSIPDYILSKRYNDDTYTPLFDDNIHYCTPFQFRSSITDQLLDHVRFSDDIMFGSSVTVDKFQCYITTLSPTTSDWTTAYNKDNDTKLIISTLLASKEPV